MPPLPSGAREVPLAIPGAEFRRLGHELVDRIAGLLEGLPDRPVTPGEPPSTIRARLGSGPMPESGTPPDQLLREATELLFEHSLFNGHPRFWGYITSSPAPIGILGDLLAAAVNPNVGAFILSPMATEMEAQTVRWIAELMGYPAAARGLLVSGGNVANFVGFLAARRAIGGPAIRERGLSEAGPPLRVYASRAVHTWIQKAADLFGHGAAHVRYIEVDGEERMRVDALRRCIEQDRRAGDRPFLVVGTAGSVGTGSIDPLGDLALVCREHGLWFHVDGAYGGLAACLPDAPEELGGGGLALADSVAVDPHKWLYTPLEAGCVLVRRPEALREAFEYQPDYYRMGDVGGEETLDYNAHGPQNSRGFRALKVWLALRHAGRAGYARMIGDDVALARRLYDLARAHPELEAVSHRLSITTFRYVPPDLPAGDSAAAAYLNRLNETIAARMQEGGEAFVSNAVVGGRYLLRACVVNFNTTTADLDALPELAVRLGRAAHRELRAQALEGGSGDVMEAS